MFAVEMETIRTTDMDGSHEPSSSSFFSREIHILGTLEVYNEEISPKCVKLVSYHSYFFRNYFSCL